MRVLALSALLTVAGCATPIPSARRSVTSNSPSPAASLSRSPSTLQSATPSPELTAEDIARAVRVRRKYGLRSDEAWIRFVATDPSAGTLEGVPLTKAEEATVAQLVAPFEAVVSIVKTYAASQPDYAGVSIDWHRGGIVTAYFVGGSEAHLVALRDILPAGARFEVIQVHYTRDELLALSRQVDASWLESIGAKFISSGVDPARNQVRVEVSSSNPGAAQAIITHYSAAGRMYVESDRAGAAFLPTGTLLVVAVDGQGRPKPGLIVTYTGDLPGTGSNDVGSVTDNGGRWRGDVTATSYQVVLFDRGRFVGTANATVVKGKMTTVEIQVHIP